MWRGGRFSVTARGFEEYSIQVFRNNRDFVFKLWLPAKLLYESLNHPSTFAKSVPESFGATKSANLATLYSFQIF